MGPTTVLYTLGWGTARGALAESANARFCGIGHHVLPHPFTSQRRLFLFIVSFIILFYSSPTLLSDLFFLIFPTVSFRLLLLAYYKSTSSVCSTNTAPVCYALCEREGAMCFCLPKADRPLTPLTTVCCSSQLALSLSLLFTMTVSHLLADFLSHKSTMYHLL